MKEVDFHHVKTLPFGEVFCSSDKLILKVKYLENLDIDLKFAEHITESIYPLAKQIGSPLLLSDNSSKFISSTAKARTHFSNNRTLLLFQAHAVHVKELSVRILINAFIKLNRQPIPSRLFNQEQQAIQWLLTQLKE